MALSNCKECDKQVSTEAKVCPHCGVSNPTKIGNHNDLKDMGIALIAIPVICCVMIFFWIWQLNLLQSPTEKMNLIFIFMLVSTASLAAYESNSAKSITNKKDGTYSPIAWFMIVLMIWPIGYPVYLYKRKYFGLKNLLWPSIGLMVLFNICYASTAYMIDKKQKEIERSITGISGDFTQENNNYHADDENIDSTEYTENIDRYENPTPAPTDIADTDFSKPLYTIENAIFCPSKIAHDFSIEKINENSIFSFGKESKAKSIGCIFVKSGIRVFATNYSGTVFFVTDNPKQEEYPWVTDENQLTNYP